ncbi:MAG: hypothetical protein JWN91_3904 [Nocardioides sp.]|nr:hypothetical protein [Nocardioides sp.]
MTDLLFVMVELISTRPSVERVVDRALIERLSPPRAAAPNLKAGRATTARPDGVTSEGTVFLQLLGPVSIGADEGDVTPVAGAVPSSVLAHLALAGGRHVDVDSLAGWVWDAPPDSARNGIQVAVSRLRKQAGSELFDSGRGRYRLRADLVRIDWFEAQQLVGQARTLLRSGDVVAAEAALAETRSRFAGSPLNGLDSLASATARTGMLMLATEAAVLHGEALVRLGRAAEAVALMRPELDREPLNEPAWRVLMRALTADGRPAEALAAYGDLRRRLADDLGTDPAPETAELFTAILTGSLVGPHEPAGARTSTAAAVVATAKGRRLPQPGAPLLGRDAEAGRVSELLGTGHRLVTLLGPGGIGKTHLAVVAAREAASQLGWESIFVDLAPCTTSADVATALATATDAEGTSLAEIGASLAGRSVLVLLDNAEQAADAVAAAALALLGNPGTALLVTSRLPLKLHDERVVDVGPLDVQGPGSAGVRLLVDRSETCSPESLLPLARQADGYPLVLELLGSALRWRSPQELLEGLAGHLSELHDDARDRPARHASLAAVLDWSLERASVDARRGLHALTLIRGTFDRAACSAVLLAANLHAPPAAVLAELVDLGLVQRVVRPGSLQFRILEPVRDYATSLDGDDHSEAVRRAHAHHFTDLLLRADAATTDTQMPLIELVRAHEPDLVAAVQWSLDHRDVRGMDALASLLFQWSSTGRWSSAIDWSRRALADGAGPPVHRAQVSLMLVTGLLGSGCDDDEMRELVAAVEPLAAELPPHWFNRWIRTRVELALLDGDPQAALGWSERFLTVGDAARFRAVGSRVTVLLALGEWQESLDILLPLLDTPALQENAVQHANVLCNAGFAASQLGKLDLADGLCQHALDLGRRYGLSELLVIVQINRAWVDLRRGRHRAAVTDLVAAIDETPELLAQEVDMAEVAVIGGLALLEAGVQADAAVLAAYSHQVVTHGPGRFDVNMHQQVRHLLARTGGAPDTGRVVDAQAVATLLRRSALTDLS